MSPFIVSTCLNILCDENRWKELGRNHAAVSALEKSIDVLNQFNLNLIAFKSSMRASYP